MSLKQRSSFVLFMHRFVPVLTVLLAVFSTLAINLRTTPVAEAATNSTINFQARLQSASGAIVPDGNYNIQFKLYGASSGGTALWTEDHYNNGSNGLRTVNGYFSTKLGSVTAFPSTINWDQELWLTMNVGGTTTGTPSLDGEMNPRLKLTAVPYAISAGQLQTTNGSYTSKLGIQAPTGGNQVFQIQDQGAAGTYNILTAASGSDGYVKLQGSTPGTQQTGNLNISGTGMFGILQSATIDSASGGALTIGGANATSVTIGSGSITTYIQGTASINKVLSGEFDSGSSAIALAIGNTNATTINIGSTSVARAINIGTGAAAQTVTIGSTSSGSSTTINAGGGNLYLSAASGATINNLIGGVTAFQLDTSGRAIFKPITDGTSSFQVQNASGSGIFYVDTTNNVAASCATCGLTAGTGGISINGGALTIAGGGSTSFHTPGTNGDGSNGVDIATKINIPIYNPGAYSQILALGLSSNAASTARAILIADARTTTHQATIGVLSPDESQIGGFSWDGANDTFRTKTTSAKIQLMNSGNAGLSLEYNSGTSQQLTILGEGGGTTGVLQLNNASNANNASLQAPSVSTSYVTNLPTAIGTAGQCLAVSSVSGSTQQLGYTGCLTSSNGVQLQSSTPGTAQTGNLNISGTGIFGSALQTPLVDTASAGALNIGTTNATSINLNQDTTLAAGKILTITGGNTGSRPASPTEGMVYYDTTTKKLLTYSNGKWQADRTSGVLVAASDSTQAVKDAADFVADGTGDQATVAAAIDAIPGSLGGLVYLLPGTYNFDASLDITRNGVTLTSEYAGAVIVRDFDGSTLANGSLIKIEAGQVTIKKLALDGQPGTFTDTHNNAIYIASGWSYATIESNALVNHAGSAVYIDGDAGLTDMRHKVKNNDIATALNAVYAVNAASAEITGNTIFNASNSAIALSGAVTSTVSGNSISSVNGVGISIQDGSGTIVSGNTVNAASGEGIILSGDASNTTVSGNNLTENGIFGSANAIDLLTATGSGNSITGNTIYDSTGSSNAVAIGSSATKTYVADNNFRGAGIIGIDDQSSSTIQSGQMATNGGDFVFRSASSSTAFQIQNGSGVNVLSADTSAGTITLGTSSTVSGQLIFADATSNYTAMISLSGLTGNRSIDLPDENGTICLQSSSSCGFMASGSGVTLQGSTPGSAQTGNLNISGTGIFGTAVTTGQLTATGDTLIRSTSSTAFQLQNASNTVLFAANTSTSTITLGSSASGNYITFTAAGGLESYGTSQHTKSMVLAPEYTNAVFDAASDSACSSANNGTLTSLYDSTNYRNYYNWTSTQASNQCYDVVVSVVLPNDFSSWASNDPINLQALASNTSNAGYAIAIRNVTGAAWDGNYGSSYASPGSISTSWSDVASSSFSGTYAAGDRLSIKIRMTAKSSANLQLGNLTLNYNSKW